MRPESFCSGYCSPICSWTSSYSGDSLARYVSGRHAAAWQKRPTRPLTVTEGDGNIGVKGSGFEVLFSISEQGPVSLRKNGAE